MTTDKTGGLAALFRPHAAKRLSIIDAAASVFCREGFGGANIDLIAAEAGVSRQTVYNHHRDKETLFKAVVSDVTERTNADFFATLATFPDHPQDLEADLSAFASATSARTSATPDVTADSWRHDPPARSASRRASVVLPDPGGPHSTIEGR